MLANPKWAVAAKGGFSYPKGAVQGKSKDKGVDFFELVGGGVRGVGKCDTIVTLTLFGTGYVLRGGAHSIELLFNSKE